MSILLLLEVLILLKIVELIQKMKIHLQTRNQEGLLQEIEEQIQVLKIFKKVKDRLNSELQEALDIDIQNIEMQTVDIDSTLSFDISIPNSVLDYKYQEAEYETVSDSTWYKPWTWLQESGYYRTKYKTVSFVNGGALAQEFFSQIEQAMRENGKNACKHAKLQSIKIAEQFKAEFKRLDVVLKNKLAELENYATDKKLAEDRVKESELKLAWLKQINVKVESILEI